MSQVDGTTESADAEPQAAAARASWVSYAWVWVPTLYFAQGMPNLIVTSLSGDMYVLLGVGNDRMARWTSWIYLPWVIKPLWSPLVDAFGSARQWIVGTQVALAAALLFAAWGVGSPNFFAYTLIAFWMIAFASATYDIAADGFYMKALPHNEQAWFVGIRSIFFRLSMVFVTGGMLWAAGSLSESMPDTQAWAWTLTGGAAIFAVLAGYHQATLPRLRAAEVERSDAEPSPLQRITESVPSFFAKPGMTIGIAYLLVYRVGEAQLTKLAKPFLLDEPSAGGLAMSAKEVGAIYGGVGVGLLIVGGLLGGIVAAKLGLRRVIVPMALAIHLFRQFEGPGLEGSRDRQTIKVVACCARQEFAQIPSLQSQVPRSQASRREGRPVHHRRKGMPHRIAHDPLPAKALPGDQTFPVLQYPLPRRRPPHPIRSPPRAGRAIHPIARPIHGHHPGKARALAHAKHRPATGPLRLIMYPIQYLQPFLRALRPHHKLDAVRILRPRAKLPVGPTPIRAHVQHVPGNDAPCQQIRWLQKVRHGHIHIHPGGPRSWPPGTRALARAPWGEFPKRTQPIRPMQTRQHGQSHSAPPKAAKRFPPAVFRQAIEPHLHQVRPSPGFP